MRPTDNIRKFIEKASVTSNPNVNKAVLNELAEEMEKTKQTGQNLNTWRIIMKSPITKFAAAAVIIIAVVIGLIFLGVMGKGGVAWADVIKPILSAKTAKFDMIVGQEGSGAVITDMVKGSRIRRTIEGINQAVIIDLETSKILTLEENTKTATYIDLKNLPPIKNYLELLRNVISKLENTPGFEVKRLGEKNIDGKEAVGFMATCPVLELTIWADRETANPIRIEQKENNLNVICKNFQFDLEMDDSLFSMDVPDGYKLQQMNIDLTGSTEEDFITGLRLLAEISDGVFPEDISIEYFVKNAVQIGKKMEALKMSDDENVKAGEKLTKLVTFLRFFKGEGKWHYAGDGVKLGDAAKAVFWYKPKDSQTWRVIYGDLRAEDVEEANLPQPVEKEAKEPIGYQQWEKKKFTGVQEDQWHITSSGKVEAHIHLLLTKAPADTYVMTLKLPYGDANLITAKLGDSPLQFKKTRWAGQYDVNLPLEKMNAGQTDVNFVWIMPLDKLEKVSYGYRAELAGLIPVGSYKLTIVLDDRCGYIFSEDSSKREFLVFSWDTVGEISSEPKSYFGSCGIPINPAEKQ
jgi:outer membrane lipoprotein-sorting protein